MIKEKQSRLLNFFKRKTFNFNKLNLLDIANCSSVHFFMFSRACVVCFRMLFLSLNCSLAWIYLVFRLLWYHRWLQLAYTFDPFLNYENSFALSLTHRLERIEIIEVVRNAFLKLLFTWIDFQNWSCYASQFHN